MADTGVPQVPLPRYDLPNPGLPFGQQAVPQVAQTNPLMALNSGIMGGAQMGLQAGALGLQAKEMAMKQQQMQVQAKALQRESLIKYLDSANEEFKTMADNNFASAMDFYKTKMAPVHSFLAQQMGLGPISPESINLDDHPQKDMTELNSLMRDSVANPDHIPHNIAGIQEISNRPEMGKIGREKSQQVLKAVQDIENSSKHQDELAQQWVTNNQSLRGDQVYKGLETQRNSAAQGYDTLRKNQNPDGSFDLSNGQIIDLYGQLWKAQTGGVLSPDELKEMNQASLQKNYAKLTGLVGLSKNALPTQVGNRLLTMFSNLGDFTEKQHASMEASKGAKPGGLTDPTKIAAAQAALGRGMTFHDMKAQSDAEYQAKTQKMATFKSEAEALKANLPKGTIVVINGKRARID